MGLGNDKIINVGFALLLIVAAFPAYDFLRHDVFTRELVVRCEVERVYDRKVKGDGFPRSVLPNCQFSFDKLFCKTKGESVYRFLNNSGKLEVFEEAANLNRFQLAVIEPYSIKLLDEGLRHRWIGKGPFASDTSGLPSGKATSFNYNRLSGLIDYTITSEDYNVRTTGRCSRISPAPDIPLLLNDFFLSGD